VFGCVGVWVCGCVGVWACVCACVCVCVCRSIIVCFQDNFVTLRASSTCAGSLVGHAHIGRFTLGVGATQVGPTK
jgi:hypothetical protein